jgi:bifunctional polynucleotide phosphatase/kinase
MKTLHHKFTKSNKFIASFDLDNTLIRTKSGNKFPLDGNDYEYAFDNVKEKIDELINNGYKIVIFTNQKGISMNKVSKEDIINKIEKLFPFADYFISSNDDIYRKPMIGMYRKFIELNGETKKMFYVGDAAGRKSDHSYADINFAFNAGIEYHTETKYFLKKIEKVTHYCPKLPKKTNYIFDIKEIVHNTIIIMQGFPASGKTSFIKEYIKHFKLNENNYLHLSNDSHTKSKIKKEIKKGIEEEKLIFIDNLNATVKNRNEFMKLVPDYYIKIGIHIMTDMDVALSLNKQRYYISNVDTNYKGTIRKKVPKVVYNTYKKRYEPMTKDEGFNKIYKYIPEIKLKYCF